MLPCVSYRHLLCLYHQLRVSLRLSASISADPLLSAFWSWRSAVCCYCVVSHLPFIGGGCSCTMLAVRIWPQCRFLGENGGLKEQDYATGLVWVYLPNKCLGEWGKRADMEKVQMQNRLRSSAVIPLVISLTCATVLAILEGMDFIPNATTVSL